MCGRYCAPHPELHEDNYVPPKPEPPVVTVQTDDGHVWLFVLPEWLLDA